MSLKKSWRERLASYPHLPNVKEIPAAMRPRRGEGTIATPSPQEVEAAMRGVPEGRLATVMGIGEDIAARHHATIGCTVTTAIFAHMVAHATEEAPPTHPVERTPWWRTLKIGGELNPKYPGGIEAQMSKLEAEGHTVVQRGKRYFVEGFAKKLTGTR
ncbi:MULTISPECIES: MGMT family protein [Variovorax]|jgi:alkylated DNA nucleotide flippase Atl1|uniref:MGMT family protein n=1 Tax=Variovorax TaxID=34072 RepID=UPI00086DA1B5|nr:MULTISPECIES: MGMT family protein [Variovorax]ODU15726.1 MAG: 6-O-methylguanine DNA methyltransferase [Variovorax sp. SCN 67-85]ODV27600.1 MAG: 6-O-methylguanine DNA methyltransferase [Variovorax sp. SCN 67-20]OJZ11484.1 MAG: 6-O-methylguanine DNA methyltransferase [Variovorax sp. 67-131]UKI05869.1 MGMT family protein [Variovorax paradoxus]